VAPIVTLGRVVWAADGYAVIRVGLGTLVIPQGTLEESDLLELTIQAGTTYAASCDERMGAPFVWVLLRSTLGASAITLPRGSSCAPRVDISYREVDLETSEGFDTDPDTSDPTVPAAGTEPDDADPGVPFEAMLTSLLSRGAPFPLPQ
jgi:hypothetical protein